MTRFSPEEWRMRFVSASWILSLGMTVFALLFCLFPSDSAPLPSCRYVMRLSELSEEVLPQWEEGDILFDRKTGTSLGRIKKIETFASEQEIYQGRPILIRLPGKYDIEVTLRAPAERKRIGEEISFQTKTYYGHGTVYRVLEG